MRIISVSVIALFFALPANSQIVAQEKPSTACTSAPTYDNGLNITISVITTKSYGDQELEQIFVRDLARFKDTNLVRSTSDPTIPIGKRPVAFEITIFWAEVKQGDRISGYVASAFTTETCAVFDNRNTHSPGFSTHVLLVQSSFVNSERDKIIDGLEKSIYDGLVKIAQQRRVAASGG